MFAVYQIIIMSIIVFFIAVSMSMVGKGGGNFYVLAMVLAGVSMHEAATSSQLIMMVTSLTSMLVFNKHKKVDWKLGLMIEIPTAVMAFVGGYFAGNIEGITLKLMFAILMLAVTIFMLIPVKEKPIEQKNKFGYWNRTFKEHKYTVNLLLVLPLTGIVGFFAGAIGISGGVFKVPLMVMLCGIPMEIAVGTSSAMVALTAFMGFMGHTVNGSFSLQMALPLSMVAVIGGFLGSKFAVKSKPKNLKKIFAITNLIAVAIMIMNILK